MEEKGNKIKQKGQIDNKWQTVLRDFWPRWRHRHIYCATLHNQEKDNKFKNKKQPELPEN